MEVTWFGGSCFRLLAGGLQILTDPFGLPADLILSPGDIVTLSRRVSPEHLAGGGAYRVIDGPGEYEIKGVPLTGIATGAARAPAPPAAAAALDGAAPDAGAPPASGAVPAGERRNVVYTAVLDGVAVCHLGRLEQIPPAAHLQAIGSPEVVLFPLGEGAGLTVPQAVQLASQLEARLLVPVALGGGPDEEAVERFCRELGADPANFSPRLSVSSSGLPVQAQVVRLRLAPARPEPAGRAPGPA